MGLYASFNLQNDLGLWSSTRNFQFPADYTMGNWIFKNTFDSVIRSNCPVRTGNLLSSIKCYIDGLDIILYTDCEYAQFVEYGTWKQDAQPYFEQAIETAINSAYDEWVRAYELVLTWEYYYMYDQIFSEINTGRQANSQNFLQRWAENAARVSVETQAEYLEIGIVIPETQIT